jgi:hypothetical protein
MESSFLIAIPQAPVSYINLNEHEGKVILGRSGINSQGSIKTSSSQTEYGLMSDSITALLIGTMFLGAEITDTFHKRTDI